MADADTTPAAKKPKRSWRWQSMVPLLAIVVAFGGVLLAAVAWQQSRRLDGDLQMYRQGVLGSFESTSGDMRSLADTIEQLQQALAARDARAQGLDTDLEALAGELRALARRVDGLQGGRLDARDEWLREQIEYYLVLANAELGIRGETGGAIAALELADGALLELGNPGLGNVRRAIAAEMQALRAVPQPDVEGIALDLGSLMARVAELPMRAAAPDNYVVQPDADAEDEPGLGRLWDRTKGAVTSIVRIEREEEPVELVLTDAERRLSRRQLGLELQIARTSLAERRQADFRASLMAADALLNQDFDREARSIVSARELLGELMTIELAPPLPDISASLTLLRAAAGAR